MIKAFFKKRWLTIIIISIFLLLLLVGVLFAVNYFKNNKYDTVQLKDDGPIVIDAINYSRDVDLSDPQFEYAMDLGYKTGDYKHNIVIPKITLKSENANEFNAKIYNLYKSQYEDIVNHKELQPLDITYTFKQQNGLVGIIITEQGGPIAGGGWFKYQCLYYDLNKDCEISFEEYLSTLGTSYTDLWNWFTTTNEYKNDYANWGLDKIIGAAIDNVSMDLVVNLTMGYDNAAKLSFEESVISKQSTVSNSGIVLDTPYFTLTLPSSWAGKYADANVRYYPEGSNNYEISIAEKHSYDALSNDEWCDDGFMYGIGGHLVTYGATFDPNDTNRNGGDCCIATCNVDGQKVYIYCYGPTDIQYTKKGEQQYKTMQEEIGKIKINIKDEYK